MEKLDQGFPAGDIALPDLTNRGQMAGLDHVVGLLISAPNFLSDRADAPNQVQLLCLGHVIFLC